MRDKGLIVAFEGGEGSGKSTVVKEIARWLEEEQNRKVLVVREPGGSELAEKIRDLVLSRDNDSMTTIVEQLLFLASRLQLLEDKTKKALEDGYIVIYDRYIYTSIVYQGKVKGLGEQYVTDLHMRTMKEYLPDLTLYFDVDVETGLKRATSNGRETNKFEDMDTEFHKKVREGYLEIANRPIIGFVKINANNSIEQVEKDVKEYISLVVK